MGILIVLLWALVGAAIAAAVAFALFMVWAIAFYSKYIDHVVQRKPLLIAETQPHHEGGEAVEFQTPTGRRLAGSYFHHSASRRRGVVLFCHEFAGDRWLFEDYAGPLLARGFDVCSFDFCNHGKSDSIVGYEPAQWVTSFEVEDVRAAIDGLLVRPDADPNGVALFGVSKGGGAAVVAAAERPSVWALVMDGAYPNHGMIVAYMTKWVGIFSAYPLIYNRLPSWFFRILCEWSLFWMARRKNIRFARLERAVRHLGDRPVFMIRGARDNYVTRPIVDRWFSHSNPRNKQQWDVPGAKHNRCVEAAKGEYERRLVDFFDRFAPEPAPAEQRALERTPVAERGRPQPAPSV